METHRPRRRDVGSLLGLSLFLMTVVALSVDPFDPDSTCCDHLFYRSMAFNEFSLTRPELDRPPPGNPIWTAYRDKSKTLMDWLDLRNGLARQPPFAYRLVTPALAGVIERATGGINSAFYILTFVSLVAAAFVLGLCIYVLSGSLVPALVAVAVFAINPEDVNLFETSPSRIH